jgi:superfamily II DNA or RNA helicase
MRLRDYQVKGKVQTYDALFIRMLQAIILCIPTGGGKTVVFADMAREFIEQGKRVMVLCNRRELINQACNKLKDHAGVSVVKIDPSYRVHRDAMCYVASIDTLRNRILPDIDILIVDETHIRSFDPIILEYKLRGVKIIGCTATPERTGKKFLKEGTMLADAYPDYTGQLGNVYQEIITPTTIAELLAEDHLVEAVYYLPEEEADLSDVAKKGGEYDEGSLFEKFNKPKMYSGVVDTYVKHAHGKKMICFCVNVEHSKKTAEEFRLRGISAEHLDGKSKDRDAILDRFQKGITLILCNYGVTTTGYDEPTVEGIILNSATMVDSLYKQKVGRGSRKCDEIGKRFFIVIDHGSHIRRLGWWEQEKEYSLDLRHVSKTVGAGPIRHCEQCEAILPLSTTVCKFCDFQQVKQPAEMKLHEAKFVQVQKPDFLAIKKPVHLMNVKELEAYRESKEYALGWIVHQLVPRGRLALQEYADYKGYSKAWVNRQLAGVEEKRIANKRIVFEFMKGNTHVTHDFLKEFAAKKLKPTHTQEEIEILIPKILTTFEEIKLGIFSK